MMCLLSRLLFLFVLLSGVLQLSVGQSADNQQCASNEQVEEIVDQGTRKLEGKQGIMFQLESCFPSCVCYSSEVKFMIDYCVSIINFFCVLIL